MNQQVPINIYFEENPNPNSLKFVINRVLLSEGESKDYPTLESAANSPLAKILFERDDVERVFFMGNFVTVTKKESSDWFEIREEIKQTIKLFLESGKAIVIDETKTSHSVENDSDTVIKIKEILAEYIRPAVEMDGGAITFHSYVDGVVKVILQGACSGCPSSTITLKSGIENLMKTMMPDEVHTVEAESR